MENYTDTDAVEPALEIMVKSYEKLSLTDMASHARQALAANFPENDLVKR